MELTAGYLPMPEPLFPAYSVVPNRAALESRRRIPPDLQVTLEEIELSLCNDPMQERNPERITPISTSGRNFIYTHPDPEIQVTFEVDEERKRLIFFHYSAPAFKVPKSIFISYSHANQDMLEDLKTYLAALEQKGLISYWDDSKLNAGVPWERQIEEALASAKAGLLLVSQQFLASEFIMEKELPKLLQAAERDGKKIFWIHLAPSTVFETHQEITRFQSPMANPKVSLLEMEAAQRMKAWVEISRELSKVVSRH